MPYFRLPCQKAESLKEIIMSYQPEDEAPPRRRRRLDPLILDTLGVAELRDYIAELRDEISRVEADIDRKQSHRSAADAFFRPPPSAK